MPITSASVRIVSGDRGLSDARLYFRLYTASHALLAECEGRNPGRPKVLPEHEEKTFDLELTAAASSISNPQGLLFEVDVRPYGEKMSWRFTFESRVTIDGQLYSCEHPEKEWNTRGHSRTERYYVVPIVPLSTCVKLA